MRGRRDGAGTGDRRDAEGGVPYGDRRREPGACGLEARDPRGAGRRGNRGGGTAREPGTGGTPQTASPTVIN
ncbi:MAG: hypothetical protein LBH21_01005 [Gracilibacteraceae bacterium]|nr:hypothetical protein [Gracilibacteraceae bacterium]